MEGTYINKIKASYNKHTANIILNGEKLKVFLQIRKKTLNIVSEFLAIVIRQEKII